MRANGGAVRAIKTHDGGPGDFNDWMWPGSVQNVLARHLPGRTPYRTFPAAFPVLKLDRIYCRPAAALVRSWIDHAGRAVSDHLPIIA
jgi:endonuclease/exonuclease/phosphatase family metal-dependent hydrolase